ncbi:MAG: MFS transporter [Chthoniobacteraceae bacterium]
MNPAPPPGPWYREVTRYQWLVLVIASAGWVFDTFEGQIFNIVRVDLLKDILRTGANDPLVRFWGDRMNAMFLLGGTVGGVLFGSLADRLGRRPVMIATILMYSVFSGMNYFATELWHIGALRFLMAMGAGGEWAVAAALVAEIFPQRARAHASGIFHGSSVLGTWLATAAGLAVGTNWRLAFLFGTVPALLTLWVRASVKESDRWENEATTKSATGSGSFRALFGDPRWRNRALLGLLFAMTGLATFWGVTVASQDIVREFLLRIGMDAQDAAAKAKFAFGFVVTAGGGVGAATFGAMSARLGRKPTFAMMLTGALLIVPAVCYLPRTHGQMLALLPLYGFFTFGFHGGYAVYFPELFPTRLRSTGSGICFNGGRLLAAPVLFWIVPWLKAIPGLDLRVAVMLVSLFYLAGLTILFLLPETKGRALPED